MQSGKYPYRFAIFMIAYYMTNAVNQGFMSLYYSSRGFTSTETGVIFAAVALVSLFAQPIWGTLGDRLPSRTGLLKILSLAAGASVLSFLLTDRFWSMLPLVCLFACFYTSIQPMGDSVILAALEQKRQPFGPIRLAGGLAYAVSSLLFGYIFNLLGREDLIIWVVAGLCMAIAPSVNALPATPGYQSATGRKMSFGMLLRNRELMLLMLFMLPMQMTMGYFYTFFSPLFMSMEGGGGTLLGAGYFISAISEAPYLLLSDRLYDRLGAGRQMCIAGLMLTLRWIMVAVTDNVWVLLASQVLHGWGFIVMTVAMAKHISRTVPRELQASGQMLLGVVTFGLARVAGNLGGGVLADCFGMQNVFYGCAMVCAATLLLFAPKFLRRDARA